MHMNSDDEIFEAVISKVASEHIEELCDYGENDPFTETDEFEEMMDQVYASLQKKLFKPKMAPKVKMLRRIIILAALIGVALFGSLNASAFRIFFYKTYLDVRGDILNIKTDTEAIEQTYNSISEFEYKNEIMIPGWLPKGTELVNIDDTKRTLMLSYKYIDDEIILIEKNIVNAEWQKSTDVYLENSAYEVDNLTVKGFNISIVYLKGTTGKKSYIAIWNNDTVAYTLKAETEESLLYAILYSLKHIG